MVDEKKRVSCPLFFFLLGTKNLIGVYGLCGMWGILVGLIIFKIMGHAWPCSELVGLDAILHSRCTRWGAGHFRAVLYATKPVEYGRHGDGNAVA